MPLKDGKRGSLIFSVTETIAGSEASRPKTPSSVSRSPVILPSATTTLRSCVSCGDAQVLGDDGRNSADAAVGGLVAGDDQVGRLVVLEGDLSESSSERPCGLDRVGAVQCRVVDVDGLVGGPSTEPCG